MSILKVQNIQGISNLLTVDGLPVNVEKIDTIDIVFDHANSGYNQANTGYTIANIAFIQANTVFERTNSVYNQANTGYTIANIAFIQANTVFGRTNSVYDRANSSFDQATLAFTKANSAFVLLPGDIVMSGRQLSTPTHIGASGTYLANDYPLIANSINFRTGGATWSSVSSGITTGNTVYSIAYANNIWLIGAPGSLGGALARSSNNGVTWTTSYDSSFNYNAIAYGNNVWIAVGWDPDGSLQPAYIRRSVDGGLSWTQITSETSGYYQDVAYGNGVWIVVRFTNNFNLILRSTDNGLTWGTANTGFPNNEFVSGVAYANNVWLIYGSTRNALRRSTDNGVTWSNVASGGGRAMAYGNGVWISAGGSGIMLRSVDEGATWSSANSGFGSTTTIQGITYDKGTWIAVGDNGEMRRSTDNGILWYTITSGFGNITIGDVAYGNGVWIAGGSNGSIRRSVDSNSTFTVLPIFAGDGKFVYTGQ